MEKEIARAREIINSCVWEGVIGDKEEAELEIVLKKLEELLSAAK